MFLENLLSFASRFFLSSGALSTCLGAKNPRQISCALARKPVPSRVPRKEKTRSVSADEVARLAGTLDAAERKNLVHILRRQIRSQNLQSKKNGREHRIPSHKDKLLARRSSPRRAPKSKCRQSPKKRSTTTPVPKNPPRSQAPKCFVDLRSAYLWFWTSSYILVHERRDDDASLLSHSCSPLQLVFLLSQGWLSPEACTAWKDARYTLGKGLLELANLESAQFCFPPISSRPTSAEVHVHISSWRRGRTPLDADTPRYDWTLDAADRAWRGPFGPALLPYADIGVLERAFELCSNPDIYVHGNYFPGNLGVLLEPLMRCRQLSGSEPLDVLENDALRIRGDLHNGYASTGFS